MIIEDGKGSGKKARVDSENRLVVNARSESIQHYTSQEEENADPCQGKSFKRAEKA